MSPRIGIGNIDVSSVQGMCLKYPRNQPSGKMYEYGTAGFRMNASFMDSVAYRMGLLAVLRSCASQQTYNMAYRNTEDDNILSQVYVYSAVGVMITASHNPPADNGLKIVDHNGGMLEQSWEPIAYQLANAEESDVWSTVCSIAERLRLPVRACDLDEAKEDFPSTDTARSPTPARPLVFLAYDTRASSPRLAALVQQAVLALGGVCVDYALTTTPQLHYYVGLTNSRAADAHASHSADAVPVAVADDYATLFDAYTALLATADVADSACMDSDCGSHAPPPLVAVDCANGVGAAAVREFLRHTHSASAARGKWLVFNDPCAPGNFDAEVNAGCGAEHVQKTRSWPVGVPVLCACAAAKDREFDAACGGACSCAGATGAEAEVVYASVDGDCDRLVLFLHNPQTSATATNARALSLIDGDKIALLLVATLREWLHTAGLNELALGLVQTPYANGASTRAAAAQGVRVLSAHTGVKHLHRRAEELDVGVYFEANGHGTVLFSAHARAAIARAHQTPSKPPAAVLALRRLQLTMDLLNPYIGDALADLLCVLAMLRLRRLSPRAWSQWYSDTPSVMDKVIVPDRTRVAVSAQREDVCVAPSGLQAAIDTAVSALRDPAARAFVRPSGTEDIVRVYAEAHTAPTARTLCRMVQGLVAHYAGDGGCG